MIKTYIPEGKSETDVTDKIFTVEHLNQAIELVGGRKIISQSAQYTIEGGRIDNVGFTDKKSIWVFEHMASSGKADQIHTSKNLQYTTLLSQTNEVEGGILFCDTVSEAYKKMYQDYRELSSRRKKWAYLNLHFVKAQWDEQGNFIPELFNSYEAETIKESTIDYYKDFYKVYACDWSIQREENNGNAITLWHRVSELPTKYMAYVHTTKSNIKIGMHCLQDTTSISEKFMNLVCPGNWSYRKSLGSRSTIEIELPKDSLQEQWADETEKLKRLVRKQLSLNKAA